MKIEDMFRRSLILGFAFLVCYTVCKLNGLGIEVKSFREFFGRIAIYVLSMIVVTSLSFIWRNRSSRDREAAFLAGVGANRPSNAQQ